MINTINLFVGGLLFVCLALPAQELKLTTNGQTTMCITLAESASAPERTAAKELASYLEKVTGAEFSIVKPEEAVGRPVIAVGPGAARALAPALNLVKSGDKGLGEDGIIQKTIQSDASDHGMSLILTGAEGSKRGTLYAVFEFLEREVGVRWWTHTEEFVPKKPTLTVKTLDIRYKPRFFFREIFGWGMVDAMPFWSYDDSDDAVKDWRKVRFAARLRNNGSGTTMPASLGGCYLAMGRGHTFNPFLPASKYFKDHPEWYSERGGERVLSALTYPHSQPCMTNDEMLEEMTRNILIKIREQPHLGMVHVSQNDNQAHCLCAKCKALDDAEGSHAASLLYGVNKIAAAIEKEFPDFYVVTFAYQYTRKPPKTLRPRSNVLVQYCVIERTGTQPIDSEENRKLMNDLKGWAAAAPKLMIWDYTMNFSGPMAPHPNWQVFGPDFRTYRDNNAVGVFCESQSVGITDFVDLKVYLMAHLLWDPSRNEKEIINEFVKGYYGKAGPFVQQVLDIFENKASKVRMGSYNEGPYASWLDLEAMNRATELFQKAEVAIADDPVVFARVKRARISLDHQWLRGYASYREQAKNRGVKFLGPQDPAKGAADFSASIRAEIAAAPQDYTNTHMPYTIQLHCMNKSFDAYLDELTQLATKGKSGSLPACFNDIAPSKIINMDHTLASVLYNVGAQVVVDTKSTSGLAMKVPKANVTHWAARAETKRFETLGGFGRYRVYAVVRCDIKSDTGAAFSGGVWDNRNRKGLGWFSFPIGKAAPPLGANEAGSKSQVTLTAITKGQPVTDGEYHLYDFGVYDFAHDDMLVWLGTTTGDIYVERFVFVREDLPGERPGPFRLEALVDFPDDAITAPLALTPGHIDSLMARLAALGVHRVSWAYYGDGHGGWLMPAAYTEDYQGGWPRCADTYLNLGNPLRVAVEAGHRHGLEVYAYFKPYETGAGMLFPEGSPQAKTMGLLPHLGGQLAWMEPFVRDNPGLRLRRRDDVPPEALTAAIRTIRLIKQDALPTRITREHLQIWTSSDNWQYQQSSVDFTLAQSVEPAPHEVRDHQGKLVTSQGEEVCVLTLAGLDLTNQYVLVTTDFTDGAGDFSNAGTAILTAHDAEGREIPGVFATGGTVWTASLVNFREGGLTFDYGWGAKLVTLDAPNLSGKSGFIAFTRGRNAYLPGSLCESEPRVQEFWLACLEEMIAAGVDGVDFREESHSSHTDTPEDYGFNDVVLQQCGDLQGDELVARIREVRGHAYTEFLRTCKTRLAASGRGMRYNLQLDFFRPDPPTARLLAYPANINFEWQRWLDEGLMDEAILRFYQLPFAAIFEDPVAEAMIGRCQQRGIPIVVNRYVGSAGDQLPQEIARVRADARFSGFILYETANFIEFNAAGGCSLRLPVVEEAVEQLRVDTARPDVISIDFNRSDVSNPLRTASGTVTDFNGHNSLAGQVGLWNELLVGNVGGGVWQPAISNTQYTIGSLLDGSGSATGVSFTFNTGNAVHFAYLDGTVVPNVLHRDMVGVPAGLPPVEWRLTGLETSTVYRLRMFGQESGVAGAEGVSNLARFTAAGSTSDNAFCIATRNYVDLWVKSTAGGEITGTIARMSDSACSWSGMQIEWNGELPARPL